MRMTLADLPEHMRIQAEKQMALSVSVVGSEGIALPIPSAIISEKELQRSAEAFLRSMGCVVIHMPGKAAVGNMCGQPDIIAFCPAGRVLLIELKVGKGKVSYVQKQVFKELACNGHYVHICYTMDEVKKAYFKTKV